MADYIACLEVVPQRTLYRDDGVKVNVDLSAIAKAKLFKGEVTGAVGLNDLMRREISAFKDSANERAALDGCERIAFGGKSPPKEETPTKDKRASDADDHAKNSSHAKVKSSIRVKDSKEICKGANTISFEDPRASHFLVADFSDSSATGAESSFSEAVATQVKRTLEEFKEEELPNFDVEVPRNALEIRRLPCVLTTHSQAEEIARKTEADVVIWGEAFRNPSLLGTVGHYDAISARQRLADNTEGAGEISAYTVRPVVTLYRSWRTFRKSSTQRIELTSLGHLDLPALRSTDPFLLIQFALGLHFFESENYSLAARFFKNSADKVLPNERGVAELGLIIGHAYLYLPDLTLSRQYSGEALKSVSGRGTPLEGDLLNNIGSTYYYEGDYAGALNYFRQALRVSEDSLGKDNPAVAIRLGNIGMTLYAQEEARLRKVGGPDPVAAINTSKDGTTPHAQDTLVFDDALRYLHQALAINMKARGTDHPDVAQDLNNIGMLLCSQGKFADALKHFRRALAIDEKVRGGEHPILASRLNNIGGCLFAQGDAAEALRYYWRALEIDEKTKGKAHPDVATDLGNIGMAWLKQGDKAKARDYFRRALATSIIANGDEHDITRRIRKVLDDKLKDDVDDKLKDDIATDSSP